jgi:hypothetical protein
MQGLRTKAYLEQNLHTHRQHAVYDSESKDEGHRVDVQAEEPSAEVSIKNNDLRWGTYGRDATDNCTSTDAK